MKRSCVIAISMLCVVGCDKLGDLGDTGAVTIGSGGGGDEAGGDEAGGDEAGVDGGEAGEDEGEAGEDEGEAGEDEGEAGEGSTSPPDAGTGADPTDSGGEEPMLCDPLLQDCYEEEVCVYVDDVFQCVADESGKSGHWGDPCTAINECQPGLFCADAADVNCAEGQDACCAGFCDLSEPDGCSDTSECLPFFVEGEAPPGLEDVGYCTLL